MRVVISDEGMKANKSMCFPKCTESTAEPEMEIRTPHSQSHAGPLGLSSLLTKPPASAAHSNHAQSQPRTYVLTVDSEMRALRSGLGEGDLAGGLH